MLPGNFFENSSPRQAAIFSDDDAVGYPASETPAPRWTCECTLPRQSSTFVIQSSDTSVLRELHCSPYSSSSDALQCYHAPLQLGQSPLQHAGLVPSALLWTPTRDEGPESHQHQFPGVSSNATAQFDPLAPVPCYEPTLYPNYATQPSNGLPHNFTNDALTTDPCGIPTDPIRPAVPQTRAVPHIELPNNNNLPRGLTLLALSPKAFPLRPRSLSVEPSRFDRSPDGVQQNQNTRFLQTPNPLNNGLSRHRSAPSNIPDRHNARSKNDRRRRSRSRSTHSWPQTQTTTNPETPLYSNADTSETKQCPKCEKLLHDERGLQRHLRIHSDNFQTLLTHGCSKCGAVFEFHNHLERHLLVHDSSPDTRKYKCPVERCKFEEHGFKRRDHLKRHIKKQHNLEPSDYSL